MKRKLIGVIAALCLIACGTAELAQRSTPEPEETPEVTEEIIPEQGGEPAKDHLTALREYQEGLEGYVDMKIAYLGEASENSAVDAVLKDAAEHEELKIVSLIDDSRIFYGKRGENSDYVYLIIPNVNTDITVGTYNYYAGEITDVRVEETDALPFVYVESGDQIDPVGMISLVRHFPDGDAENSMYTGLSADPARLRTDYHMGIVDITPYDSMVLPSYGQRNFDSLLTYEEVDDALRRGAVLNRMDEMMRDGHAYTVYDLSEGNESTLYGVSYDPVSGEESIIVSRDRGMSWEILGHG